MARALPASSNPTQVPIPTFDLKKTPMNRLAHIARLAAFCTLLGPWLVPGAAQTYLSDPDHTFAFFEYGHLGLSQQRHRFDDVDGKVTLDPREQTGQIDVTIQATSVNTGSWVFNEVLRGEQFFDVADHPTIKFSSTQVTFDGPDAVASAQGNLTIKGITKPLTLQVTHFKCKMHPMENKPACGVNATGTILRSDYDLGKYVPLVDDEIKLYVVLEAIEQ